MADLANDQKVENTQALVKKLNAVGWAVFLIWMGIAFLANTSWAVGLLSVGVIVLGGQVARTYFRLPVDWFWVMTGIILVVLGACELLKIQFSGSLLPLLSIVAGIAILVTALRPGLRH